MKGKDFYDPDIAIEGSIDDPQVTDVLVDGMIYPVTGGSFVAPTTLTGTPQTLSVEAGDATIGRATRTLDISP